MNSFPSVDLVVNPASGGGRSANRTGELAAALSEAGAANVVIHVPQDPSSATTTLVALAAQERERVVVAGGDGIVGRAVAALAGTSSGLGILPLGSGNDFARAFALPTNDLATAARLALGPLRAVDLIGGPDKAAASVATAGFSATVNEHANRLRLGPLAKSRYNLATMLELPRFRPFALSLRVDDDPVIDHEAMLIAVANTRYFGGGMDICPAASPDDGLLDVTVVLAMGRLELLRTFRRVFSGTHLSHPAVRTYRGARISVDADPGELSIWADGEPFATTPCTLHAQKDTLLLAVGPLPQPS